MSSSVYNQITACNSCLPYCSAPDQVQKTKVAAKAVTRPPPIRPTRAVTACQACPKIASVRANRNGYLQPTGLPLCSGLYADVTKYSPVNLTYSSNAVFGVIRPSKTDENEYTGIWGHDLVINDEGVSYLTDTRVSNYLKVLIDTFAEQELGNVTFAFQGFTEVGSSSDIANIIGSTLLNYGVNSLLYMVDSETTTDIHLILKALEKIRVEFPTVKIALSFIGTAPKGIEREELLKEMALVGFVPDLFLVATDCTYNVMDSVKRMLEGQNDSDVANPEARGAVTQIAEYYGVDPSVIMRKIGVWVDFNGMNDSDFTSLYNYLNSMGYKALLSGDIVTDSRSAPPNRKLNLVRVLADEAFTSRIIG